jgi:outer membrane protein assembly factor BamE
MHSVKSSGQHYMTIAVLCSNLRRSATRVVLLSLTSLLLAACSSLPVPQFPGVYKIPIAQGNIITQDMIDKLEPGMTPRQVIFVMGSPLVRDPFNQDRWDYVYNYQPGGGVRGQERITLYFENEQLVRYEGDFEPGPGAAWHQVANNSSAGSP